MNLVSKPNLGWLQKYFSQINIRNTLFNANFQQVVYKMSPLDVLHILNMFTSLTQASHDLEQPL